MKIKFSTLCLVIGIVTVSSADEPKHKHPEEIEKRRELWSALGKECETSKWNVKFDEIRLYVECVNLEHIYFFVEDQPYTYSLGQGLSKSRLTREGVNRLSTELGKWGEYVILWSNGEVLTSIQVWSCEPENKPEPAGAGQPM